MRRSDTMKFRYLMREAKEGNRARTLYFMQQAILTDRIQREGLGESNRPKYISDIARETYRKYTAHEKR